MGKIRVKTLGDEGLEQEQKKDAKKRQEAKKVTRAPGLKGGQRISVVGPTEEELAKLDAQTAQPKVEEQKEVNKAPKEKKTKKSAGKTRERSKKYKTVAKLVDRTKLYSLVDALDTLPKIKMSTFDETVELHITTTEKGITGTISLPHGTGKQRRVAVADEKIIENIEKGRVEFDVLLATPDMMPKLAKVARVLGPRGLMPNPKNGTITNNPEETMKKFQGGHMNYKTESKSPIIHLSVGKLSFGTKKLEDNIQTVLVSLPQTKVKKITLKSTMSPGIKINYSSVQ